VNKAVDDDVTGACGRIVPFIFHDNMFTGLNFGIATRAAAGEVGEESLSVFSNGSVAGGHAGEASTKRIGKAYDGEP